MRNIQLWFLSGLLILASLQATACTNKPASASKIPPAKVEPIGDTKLNRLVLTDKGAERIGIQTVAVREQAITRKRAAGGEIVTSDGSLNSSGSAALVRVSLVTSDLDKIDRSVPAVLQPLVRSATVGTTNQPAQAPVAWAGMTVQPVSVPIVADTSKPGSTTLYYTIARGATGLVPGQRVSVELTLKGSGAKRQVIPYSAVIYDLKGDTWVYTMPEPRTFVRQPIVVDYVEGDVAVLKEGPSNGAAIVVTGAAELYGTEFGTGK